MITWRQIEADFKPDGSLRDIYILNTDMTDWKKIINHIRSGHYKYQFSRGENKDIEIPQSLENVFCKKETDIQSLLRFSVQNIHINCHFFWDKEIEFDIEPKEINETNFSILADFIKSVGDLLSKNVLVTPENCSENPILKYDCARTQFEYFPPKYGTGRYMT